MRILVYFRNSLSSGFNNHIFSWLLFLLLSFLNCFLSNFLNFWNGIRLFWRFINVTNFVFNSCKDLFRKSWQYCMGQILLLHSHISEFAFLSFLFGWYFHNLLNHNLFRLYLHESHFVTVGIGCDLSLFNYYFFLWHDFLNRYVFSYNWCICLSRLGFEIFGRWPTIKLFG